MDGGFLLTSLSRCPSCTLVNARHHGHWVLDCPCSTTAEQQMDIISTSRTVSVVTCQRRIRLSERTSIRFLAEIANILACYEHKALATETKTAGQYIKYTACHLVHIGAKLVALNRTLRVDYMLYIVLYMALLVSVVPIAWVSSHRGLGRRMTMQHGVQSARMLWLDDTLMVACMAAPSIAFCKQRKHGMANTKQKCQYAT